MGEIGDSVAEAIRKRAASAVLGTYLAFWLIYHWQGVYTTLFVSEERIYGKFHLLKNEYVNQYFFGWYDWNSVWGFLVPVVLTGIFVWPLPKYILIHAYRLEQEYKTEKRKIRIKEEKRLAEVETELTKEKTTQVKAEVELQKNQKVVQKIDPTIIWSEEYEKFKNNRLFKDFAQIIESVYTRSGSIRSNYDNYLGTYAFEIPRNVLVYADTNGLVILSEDKERVDFTEKGRYFVRRYTEES